MQFLIALLEHPVLLVILLMCFMGFMGMTYEFILRLCGKKPFLEMPMDDGYDYDDDVEPSEPSNVPKPPTNPDDVLKGEAELDNNEIEGAEEIEDEDGNKTVEYIYCADKDPLDDNYWSPQKGDLTKDPENFWSQRTYKAEIERTH